MAYCTPEDTEYLLSQGFALGTDGQSFVRVANAQHQSIHPVWDEMRHNSIDTPPAGGVFWGAYAVTNASTTLEVVVQLSDRQPTPTSCFVTAEIRGWRREK